MALHTQPQGTASSRWPKSVATLTQEQIRVRNDWAHHYLVRLPQDYRRITAFNHAYPARSARPGRTLEIGAGLGEHMRYENLSAQEYHAVDLLEGMTEAIRRDFPSARTLVADCQAPLPYDDHSFDRAIAIHVLEHLPNLPAALQQIARKLKPGGVFAVVIPCEGGLGYGLGRRFTSKPAFERRYKTSYDWFIKSEHVNTAREILHELRARFEITDTTYYPCRIPLVDLNLLIGLTCVAGA
jgi:SAM-dependent methyltransferase